MTIDEVLALVRTELERAEAKWPRYASAHEGYAVLLEEVDEFWDEVRKRPADRNRDRMRLEAVQVATVAMRIVLSLSESGSERR